MSETKLLTLNQVLAAYPGSNKPSVRWLSKRARDTNTATKGGRCIYIFADRLPHLIEGKIWPGQEKIEDLSVKSTVRSTGAGNSRKKPKKAKSSGDPVSEARALLISQKQKRS